MTEEVDRARVPLLSPVAGFHMLQSTINRGNARDTPQWLAMQSVLFNLLLSSRVNLRTISLLQSLFVLGFSY